MIKKTIEKLDLQVAIDKLLAKGKQKGQLSHDEISDLLAMAEDLGPDQIDEILERFVSEGIEIVEDTEDDHDEDGEKKAKPIKKSKAKELVPEGIALDDPVRM